MAERYRVLGKGGSPVEQWSANPSDLPELPFMLAASANDVHTLVCVLWKRQEVGSYVREGENPLLGMPAMRISADVRLLRWPDGALLARTELRGKAPERRVTIDSQSPGIGADWPAEQLRLWLVSAAIQDGSVLGHENPVRALAFSPDGRTLATAASGSIFLWDVQSRQRKSVLRGAGDAEVISLAFSPDGKMLASGRNFETADLWDWAAGRQIRSLTPQTPVARAGDKSSGWSESIHSLSFSPDSTSLAAARSGNVRLWDATSAHELRSFEAAFQLTNDCSYCVLFSPDGRTLAWARTGGRVGLTEVPSGDNLRELGEASASHRIVSLAFSPDGRLIATGKEYLSSRGEETETTGLVSIWEVSSGKEVRTFRGHAGGLWSVALSPDGGILATAGKDKRIRLWDMRTGQLLRTLTGHANDVFALAFSPSGKLLASASRDRTVKLWDLTALR